MKERGSTLLIVIGIVLVLFMIGFFKAEPSFWGSVNYKKALRLPCGITVKEPLRDARVTFPASTRGYLNGCGWEVDNGVGGSVQIFDGYGMPVTARIPLVVSGKSAPYSFSAVLLLRQVPATGNGSIVFTSTTGLVYAQPIAF